jgi:cytoskeletal protein RodZ
LSDYPRRRRLEPEPPKRGGIPIIPLMILVVLCGLALGGLLTKFLGTGGAQAPTPAPSFTPLPEATATFTSAESSPPSPSPTPSAKGSPAAKASATSKTSPSPSPNSNASPESKPKPKATQVVIVLTPTPAATHVTSMPAATATATPPAIAAAPTTTPVLITGANTSEHAEAIVNAYVGALARGDSSTAAGYLASGLPTETFINPNVTVNVSDMRSTRNNDGSYNVTAQIVTSKGTYLTTFVLRMGAYGLQITEHSAQHI